jgi:signal transduction histidine kinase
MAARFSRRVAFVRQVLLAGTLAIVLVGLAVLQYRWLGDVSAAERERMRAGLQSRAGDVAQAFDAELTRIFIAFHVDADQLDANAAAAIAEAYERWHAGAAHPAVVRAVDVIDPGDLRTLQRFDPASRTLAVADWPPAVRAWLTRLTTVGPKLPNAPSPLLLADAVDGSIPALVIAVPKVERSTEGGAIHVIADPASVARTVLVELDPDVLRDQVVAPLVTRYFGGASDSVVTIVGRDDPAHVVYASDPARPLTDRTADVTASLFDLRVEDLNHVVAARPTGDGRGKVAITIVRRANMPDGRRFLSTGNVAYAGGWRLLARYRSDSLDALVAASRRRNFALVLAVLALLGGSVSLMMVSAERARRLAQQQMEFVASVSHELRTPLAVIRSAGQNLADGVVSDAAQVKRYGSIVEGEGRRLSDMVERVLLFAGIGAGTRSGPLADVDLAHVLTDAVAATETDARERGVRVNLQAVPLPTLAGDVDALRSAIQNVIGNAVKYSRSGDAVDVIAENMNDAGVRIHVVDRGIGIDATDLPHVFKPFYRGRRAVDAQVRGSGIGLSLVRHVVREHGGDVSVESRPDAGTRVTVVLPVRSVAQAGEGRGPVVRFKQLSARL